MQKLKKKNIFLKELKDCWIILFILLSIRIEVSRDEAGLNLNKECVKKQKCWKYLKISGNIFMLWRSKSCLSGVKLERRTFKIFLIDLEKTEYKRLGQFFYLNEWKEKNNNQIRAE